MQIEWPQGKVTGSQRTPRHEVQLQGSATKGGACSAAAAATTAAEPADALLVPNAAATLALPLDTPDELVETASRLKASTKCLSRSGLRLEMSSEQFEYMMRASLRWPNWQRTSALSERTSMSECEDTVQTPIGTFLRLFEYSYLPARLRGSGTTSRMRTKTPWSR